jgi:ubiquinone/menaquinone biosynthesis C-methylase UbiE
MNEHHGHRFNHIERLRTPERLERLEVERVVDLALEGGPVQSVLDIGTGSGVFAEAFARHGLPVTGIDTNPEMLQAARGYVPSGNFREATAEEIPYPDDAFDLAFMGLVLHETDDLLKALQEAYRVTKKRLVVLEWPYAEQEFGPGLEERLQPAQVVELASQAGFQSSQAILLEQLMLYRFEKGNEHGGL